MISVENLYWIFYENLLKPVGLDAWYYYPFGTTHNLSQWEFGTKREFNEEHHVLFQFDQEPIWHLNDVYTSDHKFPRQTCSKKLCRILANSEHSSLKKKACVQYDMLDWYFFYHGLAALDWFADAQYTSKDEQISSIFLSLNQGVVSQRSYRMALTARLIEQDLDRMGTISFHGTATECASEVNNTHSLLAGIDKELIIQHLCNSHKLPLKVDDLPITGDLSACFGAHQYRLWQKSFLHLVNETVFYHEKLHLTEKIFKPIVSMRPFILAGSPGTLAYLRSYGFKTFSPWIDESYDSVKDPTQRLDMIVQEIARLCDKSLSEIQKIYNEMIPVLQYNKKHFFGDFRHLIVDELVDNFDQCIRVWNNGRVDGRELPLHPDIAFAKKILLR